MSETSNFIYDYFTGEKIQFLFVIIIGIISIISSFIFLFIIKYSFFKGMAIPLLVIGVLQTTVGTLTYKSSEQNKIRVETLLKNEPKKISEQELPKVQRTLNDIKIYKYIEISLMIVAIMLLIFVRNPSQTFWKGFGLALFIQSCVLVLANEILETRIELYIKALPFL